jgi:hypothetical protein
MRGSPVVVIQRGDDLERIAIAEALLVFTLRVELTFLPRTSAA